MVVENNKARWVIISIAFLICFWWILPNFTTDKKWWISKEKLTYGLDIQGGLHLVMEINVEEVIKSKITRAKNTVVEIFEKEKIPVQEHFVDRLLRMNIQIKDEGKVNQALQMIEDEYGAQFQVLGSNNGVIEIQYSKLEEELIRKDIILQSIEVIRNRIDEFGVSEPLITAQGQNRILIQLPGVQSAQKAKALIQKTAHLELHLVSDKLSQEKLLEMISQAEAKGGYSLLKSGSYQKYVKKLNQDLAGELPKNTAVYFMKDESSQTLAEGSLPFLLETDTGLSGDMLDDAYVGQGQFGEPVVGFRFGVEGRKRFSEVTSKNIGRLIAIVLDDVVKTAPQIKDHLFDRGIITLGGSNRTQMLEEAEMISTTLRAGALPTSLKQLEERTVGPTLGQDLINQGKTAIFLALVLILIFLIIYYRLLGLVADIALFFNIVFLFSILTSFGAVLTLPGVAGIILTVGMAVDANIIIFERLREEIKKGSSLKLAVKEAFSRAFSAIFDANITTAIVCLILMYFGTGPIRGFAVTLFCGIITSVFTAIFVSRTLINSLVHSFQLKKL